MPQALTRKYNAALFKPRKASSHKYNYGHALLLAGNRGKMGAAVLAAKACVRSGAGLTTVSVPAEERCIIQAAVPEAMMMERENNSFAVEKFTAVGFGPGMGVREKDEIIFFELLQKINHPILLDADALTILSKHTEQWNALPAGTILTPHEGEFDRLFGIHKAREERVQKAKAIAKQFLWVIVLKGPETVIVTADKYFINKTGNAGLAKGGSGDVLTGMITALLAQGYPPADAACMGVYLHGAAADLALKKQSMESMTAGDVIEYLGTAFKNLYKK